MAGLRISQLPAASAIASADVLPFSSISGSETRKVTAAVLGLALTQLGMSVGPTQPLAPYNGQPWIDTSTNPPCLKCWNGATWTILSFIPGSSIITNPGGTAPGSPVLGQLWQDTAQTPDQLKMWDGANWVRVDPQGVTQAAGDTRWLQIATAASTYLPLAGGTLTGNLTLVGAPSTANMAATKAYVDAQIAGIPAASDLTPAGTVIWTARSTAPSGYLKANGAAVSRTTYSNLFNAIGIIYGAGDGSTTFNVPDLRGEFVRGLDDGRGVDPGRVLSSAPQSEAFKSHTHTDSGHAHSISDPGHNHVLKNQFNNTGLWRGVSINSANAEGSYIETALGAPIVSSSGTGITGTASAAASIESTGGTETRPRNIALLGCIKT